MLKQLIKSALVNPGRNAVYRVMGLDRKQVTQRINETYLTPNSLEKWFLGWIIRQNTYAKEFSPRNIYFEYGIAEGNSLITFINAAKTFCEMHDRAIDEFTIYAFDSFAGLPAREQGDEHVSWREGVMRFPKQIVESRIAETGFPMSNVHLIEGYYRDSLTAELLADLKTRGVFPSIVTIDVDYYSSTKTAVDWMRPLLRSGCVFYFDDIWSFHGHPQMGELRYINEFNNEANGHLTPCNIFGLDHHSYIYASRDWEWR